MAIKKVTGNPALDAIISASAKKFGKENMVSMGPSKSISWEQMIPTGSVYLDCTLGAGGYPDNGIIEVFGPTSAGKTSMSLQLMRQYIKHRGYDRPPVFIDLERTTSVQLIESMGIDPEKVIFVYPDTAEEALQMAKDFGSSGATGFIVFDSIDAAQTEADVQRDIGSKGVGELARILSKSLRTISKIANDKQVCYIFINQIRMNIGVMYGNPEVTSGGNALPYYSSLRLRVKSKPDTKTRSLDMTIKVVKSKIAPGLMDTANFNFIPGKGVDPYSDLVSYAKDLGMMRFAGTAVKATFPDQEEETICKGGMVGAIQYLKQNEYDFERLKQACYKANNIPYEIPKNLKPASDTDTLVEDQN